MTNAANIATFGSFNANDGVYTELLGMSLGVPSRVAEELGGPGIDIAALGPVDESAHVEAWFRIGFKRTSVDTVLSAVDLLRTELRDLSTITVGLEGSAYTGTLTPTIARCVDVPLTPPLDSELIRKFKTIVDVFVRREPWVYGGTTTLYNASAKTYPAVLSLSAMTGDADAPLDSLFNFAALEANTLYMGHYPDATATIATFARELVGATWTDTSGTGAASSDNAGYGTAIGGNECWTTAGSCYTDMVVTDLEPGSYLVLAKCKTADAADPGTLKQAYGDAVTLTTTTLQWVSLGVVSLPCAAVLGAAASTLRLTLTGAGAGDEASVNAVCFVPCSFGGMTGWKSSGHAHTVRWQDGLVYADDVADLANACPNGAVKALDGVLVVVAEQATPAATTAAATTITYEPRHEQFPSAGSGAGPGI